MGANDEVRSHSDHVGSASDQACLPGDLVAPGAGSDGLPALEPVIKGEVGGAHASMSEPRLSTLDTPLAGNVAFGSSAGAIEGADLDFGRGLATPPPGPGSLAPEREASDVELTGEEFDLRGVSDDQPSLDVGVDAGHVAHELRSRARGGRHARWSPSPGEAWRRVGEVRPAVMCIGPDAGAIADALAALGARPITAVAPEEISSFLPHVAAVVIDASAAVTARWGFAIGAGRARDVAPPVVLVATNVDRSPVRRNEARRVVAEARPAVIRGTSAELAAIVGSDGDGPGHDRGAVAQVVARQSGSVVIAMGDDDVVISDGRITRREPWHGLAWQPRVVDHALDAALAAILGCGAEPLGAARAAVAITVAAARTAAGPRVGPGLFPAAMLDVLSGIGDGTPQPPAENSRAARGKGEALHAEAGNDRVALGHRDDVHVREAGPTSASSTEAGSPTDTRWSHVVRVVVAGTAGVKSEPAVGRADSNPPDQGRAEDDRVGEVIRAVTMAREVGASAVVVDVSVLPDSSATMAARHVVEVARAQGLATAVFARVDIALAAGADAAWLVPGDGSMPVWACTLVAAGRIGLVVTVATVEDACAVASAGVIAVAIGDGIDVARARHASRLPVARLSGTTIELRAVEEWNPEGSAIPPTP